MIGALAPKELTDKMEKDVIQIALGERNVQPQVRKRAILCLLRMYRKYNERYDPTAWVQPALKMFD